MSAMDLAVLADMPLGIPPPGMMSNFDTPKTLRFQGVIAMTFCAVVAAIAVAVRIYVKVFITKLYGWDDGEKLSCEASEIKRNDLLTIVTSSLVHFSICQQSRKGETRTRDTELCVQVALTAKVVVSISSKLLHFTSLDGADMTSVMGTGRGRMLGAHVWDVRLLDVTQTVMQVRLHAVSRFLVLLMFRLENSYCRVPLRGCRFVC